MWSRYPLLTNDFEVEFELLAQGPNPTTVSDGGFAFWYVYENASAAQLNVSVAHMHSQEHVTANLWMSAMRAQGFHLLGYRSRSKGWVFSSATARSLNQENTALSRPCPRLS